MLIRLILINSICILSKFTVKISEIDKYSLEDFKTHGEFVETIIKDHKTCPGVKEQQDYYKFYIIEEDGSETEEEASIATALDVKYDVEKLCNDKERWICSNIFIRPYLNCFQEDDEYLINALKEDNIRPPSTEAYNFTKTSREELLFGQYGQPIYLDSVIFKKQVKNGFFIEAGADDFEVDSNTLHFEMERGWSGLLVEPNPIIFPKGILRHRKAWSSPSCLATKNHPHTVNFAQRLFEGGMAAISPEKTNDTYELQCFPLYSLLLASAGNVTVNYLSLDIEGAEFLVLQAIPWDKVDIEVITVEVNHAGEVFPGTKEEIRNYLADQGYVYHHTVMVDDVFVRKDLYEGKYAPDMERHKWFEDLINEPDEDESGDNTPENKDEL